MGTEGVKPNPSPPPTVDEFMDSDWGDKVNSRIGLSLIPDRQATWVAAVPVRQPYAGVDFIPQSGIYEFG